jgi:hypothetical protein
MRKVTGIFVLTILVLLSGGFDVEARNASTSREAFSSEEASIQIGVPFADSLNAEVSDLPEPYGQMVQRLMAVPPEERPPLQVCFAPGTDPKIVERVSALLNSSTSPLDYFLQSRWTTTAHGGTGSQGNPITLTYSFVPDGVSIPSGAGEPAAANSINARMTALFGSTAAWKAKFAQCFARWSALTGIVYEEVSDDGATFPTSAGVLGTRGDLRISAKPIDGGYGILAFNYYPNSGDMVLDSAEAWNNSASDYLFLRNTVMHEHGHGLGLRHVCPINNTKLLEPYLSTSFDGPQHDDIRAGERYYGDRYENNDLSTTATDLGAVGNVTTVVANVSTDNATDTDWYKFTVAANKRVTATLTPVGATYYSDAQNSDGTCPSATTQLNTLDDQNLDLRLYGTNGTTILYNANTQAAGVAEIIPVTDLTAAGTYYLRVLNNSANDVVQVYQVSFTISNLPPLPTITVTAPNGGENWVVGEGNDITWTSTNLSGSVRIALSRNYSSSGGSDWQTLMDSTDNDGSELWFATGPSTTTTRIRISSRANSGIADSSNSNFFISALPPIAVISVEGDSIRLAWSPTGAAFYHVYADSIVNGNYLQLIATTADTSFVMTGIDSLRPTNFFHITSFTP